MNRATCEDGVDKYRCHCLPSYTGFNCESKHTVTLLYFIVARVNLLINMDDNADAQNLILKLVVFTLKLGMVSF